MASPRQRGSGKGHEQGLLVLAVAPAPGKAASCTPLHHQIHLSTGSRPALPPGDPNVWEHGMAAGVLAPMRIVHRLAPSMAQQGRWVRHTMQACALLPVHAQPEPGLLRRRFRKT